MTQIILRFIINTTNIPNYSSNYSLHLQG